MSKLTLPSAFVLVLVVYFHTFFLAFVLSTLIRLAVIILAARVVRQKSKKLRQGLQDNKTSQIWRISPRLINTVFGTTGRFLSVKSSFSYNHDLPTQDGSNTQHRSSPAVGNTRAKCCVTQVKFECFRIASTQVIPFSTTPTTLSTSRSALLELALRDLTFKVNVTVQICDDENELKSSAFLRLFNRTEKRNCVTVSLGGELTIGLVQIFLFHPFILSNVMNRISSYITGNRKRSQSLKTPFSVVSNLLPALDVNGFTLKFHTDVDYPTDWTNAEGATIDTIIRLDKFSLRLPDPNEGSDSRVELGLPHQLAANANEHPSDIISGIKNLHFSVMTQLKQSGMNNNVGSDISVPSLLLKIHLQRKRDLTSYLASVELSGDRVDVGSTTPISMKKDIAFISLSTGSCQIMSAFVILRRTYKPILVEFDAMKPVVLDSLRRNSTTNSGPPRINKRLVTVVLFRSSVGVRIGLDDDRKSPLRLNLASLIYLDWTRKETGILRALSNHSGKITKFVVKDLCLGHQRFEADASPVFQIDELCIDIGSHRELENPLLYSNFSSGKFLNASIGSMIFHVYDPRFIEDFFRFVGSFHSALAFTKIGPQVSSPTHSKNDINGKTSLENISIDLKFLDVYLSTAVNYDERLSQETIVFAIRGTEGLLSIAPSKTGNQGFTGARKAKNTWINFSYFESSLDFTPHKSLPKFYATKPDLTAEKHRIQFCVCGSGLKIFIAPTDKTLPSLTTIKQGARVDIMINALDLKEKVLDDNEVLNTTILKSNGLSSLAFRTTEVSQCYPGEIEPRIVSIVDVMIDFYGTALNATWSPVLQWLIASAIHKVESTLIRFKPSQGLVRDELSEVRKRKHRNVTIRTNETGVYARLVLSGGSIIDICTSSMSLSVGKEKDAYWNKANILLHTADTKVYFNQDPYAILTLSSIHYNDYIRRASSEEVLNYISKGGDKSNNLEDIVVGDDGSPLMELVNIEIGNFAELKLSPSLHFGMVIEDLSSFLKIMDEGLRVSGLEKKPSIGNRKYQLMEIKASLRYIDLLFFEETFDYSHRGTESPQPYDHKSEFFIPRLNCNVRNDNLLERLRIHISCLDCRIIRNTPRIITQGYLNDLDEDKSCRRLFGPVIQGGDFSLSIDQLHVIIHPLSIATPFVSINTFRLDGRLYLAALNSLSPEVRSAREICIPVICHHGKSTIGDKARDKNQRPCRCSFGMKLNSTGIPIKIYHDLTASCSVLNFTYGKVMASAIPKLLLITKRLIPTACVPHQPPPERSVALSWWDNLRYQFHGRLKIASEHFSFLWLLDSALGYDRSLQVNADSFSLHYECGQLKLVSENFQVILPGISYHIMRSKELGYAEPYNEESPQSSQIYEKHPFIIIPSISVDISFKWALTSLHAINSAAHHYPYLKSNDETDVKRKDLFDQFRSHGLFLTFSVKMKPGCRRSACWLTLRADVLPWYSHKYQFSDDLSKSEQKSTEEGQVDESNKSIPDVLGMDTVIFIDQLQVATWFDESGDAELDSFASSDIIHISIPSFHLHYDSNIRKEVTLMGPIRAVKLNQENKNFDLIINVKSLDDISRYNIYKASRPVDLIESTSFIKSSETCRVIDSLQGLAEQVKPFDYILIVDQLDVRNQSLDELRDHISEYLTSEKSSTIDKAPWTVLVSGLKLMWTLEIRYSVVSIVQDLLFAINYVNVNRRGTVQIPEQHKRLSNISNANKSQATTQVNHDFPSPSLLNSFDTENSFASHHNVSHLDYLLSTPTFDGDAMTLNEVVSADKTVSNFSKALFSSPLMNREESVPRFDIHLSNPQVQLHSESTGGGVILAMRAAFVEGRRFIHLFSKTVDGVYTTADSLLHRTDNLYTLDMMEIYSIKPTNSASEWLQTVNTLTLEYEQQPKFVSELRKHEPQSFAASDHFTKIMEQSTFKTLQICYNPPVEFTREELEDIIQSNLIKDLIVHNNDDDQAQGTEEYIEIAIDKLSFLLDSYQFTTTLDVIRNVLLEPPKQPRPRFYRSMINKTEGMKNKGSNSGFVKSSRLQGSSTAMDDTLKKLYKNRRQFEKNLFNKRDYELLQQRATNLLEDLDDAIYMSSELSLRRIKWSLSKVKWKVDSSTFDDRVTIDFTGFTGYHDFPRNGGIHSQLSLEDLNVSPDNSPAIIRTIVGVERSPCERCRKPFYRSKNDANSCIFHSGSFICSTTGEYRWTCCRAATADAVGCQSRPHTGKERALYLRLDAFPRVVKGLTVYRHVEGNIFPGVPHTLVLQLTKNLGQLLNEYFFEGGMASDLTSDLSDTYDIDSSDDEVVHSQTDRGSKRTSLSSKAPTKSVEKHHIDNSNSDSNVEIYFMKYWRLGEVNLNISLSGFGKYRNISDLGLSLSSFQAAYKLGSAQHLIRVLKSHIFKSLASNGIEYIRDKISRKVKRRMVDYDEEDEKFYDSTEDHVTILLGTPKR